MRDRTKTVIAALSEMIYDPTVPPNYRRELAKEIGQALGVATELESPSCSEEAKAGLASELESHYTRALAIRAGKSVPARPPRVDSYRVSVLC